jgi:septal ring factor EnvC (AmiA/AmiB activator)
MEKFELEIADQNIVVAAFRKPGGTAELFERIAQEARSHVPDVTTKKGRDQIGSLAMKVSKSKTFIEKCGKELVAEQKAQIKLIDDDRIATVKKFDELRNEILAPRDAWEQVEKDRVAKHEQFINVIRMTAAICQNPENPWASINIKDSISDLENLVIDSSLEEYEEQAKLAKFESLELLRKSLAQAEQREAEQAELERLRLAEQARLQREHEERIAHEAAEKATREAEEKARFEAERVQREKAEAEQREARLKAEKEAAELRAVQAAENERKRIEAEQFAQAEAERKAAEEREADQAHKKLICSEALKGLTDLGVSVDQGKAILNAINKGLVPHVSIKF